jgi:hypothetical protein
LGPLNLDGRVSGCALGKMSISIDASVSIVLFHKKIDFNVEREILNYIQDDFIKKNPSSTPSFDAMI